MRTITNTGHRNVWFQPCTRHASRRTVSAPPNTELDPSPPEAPGIRRCPDLAHLRRLYRIIPPRKRRLCEMVHRSTPLAGREERGGQSWQLHCSQGFPSRTPSHQLHDPIGRHFHLRVSPPPEAPLAPASYLARTSLLRRLSRTRHHSSHRLHVDRLWHHQPRVGAGRGHG